MQNLRLIWSGVLFAGLSLAPAAQAASVRELIAEGDAAYKYRIEPDANRQALKSYENAIQMEPQNVEAHWKAARAAWWLGTRLKEREQRLQAFEIGVKHGEAAVALAPNLVEPHFWLGGNYASYGETKGAFTSLMLIKKIRREMAEVNRINEAYMEAGGWRILAILDFKVPGIVGGSKSRAKQEFDKALIIAPNNPVTVYYLADYFVSMGDLLEASQTLERLEGLTPSPDFSAEFIMMKEQAITLRKKL